MATEYATLQAHLDQVRRGWKRTQALQGLAVVLIEGLGLFLLFALLDYAYAMPQGLRVTMLAGLGGILALLFGRHVIRPLRRELPDVQVAQYVEERHTQLEGALVAATEFGSKNPAEASPIYTYIVHEIVREAAMQAQRIRLGEILDLSRLKKYALAACVVLLMFGMSAVRYQDFFGRQSKRLLLPWEMTTEDRIEAGVFVATEEPVRVELVAPAEGARRILRGGSVDVKARFTRAPEGEVFLLFRTKGSLEFQRLRMDEVDELNTFALRLSDVNEDVEMMAKAGAAASENVKLEVYDPLLAKGLELTLTPPAYTRQAPAKQFGMSGDVSALTGTKVRLRALANGPLSGGKLIFDGGKELDLVAAAGEEGAAAEFEVTADTAYKLSLRGSDGQALDMEQTYFVKALEDTPPSFTLSAPGSDSSAHRLAEVLVRVKAHDDVGLDAISIFLQAGDAENEQRKELAFKMPAPQAGEHEYDHTLSIPELPVKTVPGDTLFYHVTVKDLKGHLAVSDLFMLKIAPLEVAGAFPASEPHPHEPHPPTLQLIKYIGVAWNIHVEKEREGQETHDKRCLDLFAAMTTADGLPQKFHKFKQSKTPPDRWELVVQADAKIAEGIEILKTHEPAKSVALWRKAQALLEKAGFGLDFMDKATAPGGGMAMEEDPMQAALGFLKMEIPPPEGVPPTAEMDPIKMPDYQRKLPAADAEKLKQKAEALAKQQKELNQDAENLAKSEPKPSGAPQTPSGKPSGGDPKDKPEGAQPANEQAADDRGERQKELEKRQKDLADQVRGLAADLVKKAPAHDKTAQEAAKHFRDAAARMDEAAKNLGEQKTQPATAQGKRATEDLEAGAEKLRQGAEQDLERAVASVEKHSDALAERQKKINQATGQVADEIEKRAGKPADEADLKEREKQKLQGIAKLQAETKGEVENLEKNLKRVSDWAHQAGKKETAEEVDRALRTLKQENPAQEMVTVAVNLGQQYVDDAREGQEKVKRTLDKVNAAVREANNGLAQTREEKLRAALNTAAEIAKRADEAKNGKPTGEGEPNDKKDGAEKPGEGKPGENDPKTAQGQQKPGEGKPGENDPKTAQGQQKPGEGKQGEGDPKTAQGQQKPGEGKQGEGDPKTAQGQQKPGEGKQGEGDPKTAQGQQKPGEGKQGEGDPKTAQGQQKPGEGKQGEGDPKTAQGQQKPGEGKQGENDPKTAQGQQKPGSNEPKDSEGKPSKAGPAEPRRSLSMGEKEALAGELRKLTSKFVERLDKDQLVEAGLRAQLDEANKNGKTFEQMFDEAKKGDLDRYLQTLNAVSNRLEEKLESTLKAKRLSDAQREECPIVYRKMVNSYYERIAEE